jgi:hypothetical protein
MPAREKHSSLLQTIVTWGHCEYIYNDFTYNINNVTLNIFEVIYM